MDSTNNPHLVDYKNINNPLLVDYEIQPTMEKYLCKKNGLNVKFALYKNLSSRNKLKLHRKRSTFAKNKVKCEICPLFDSEVRDQIKVT